MKRHVIIIGAGVIGLSIAWRLGERGHEVTVLERGTPGGESSGVAGGMLTLAAEADPHSRGLTPLRRLSARLYPDTIEQLENLTGRNVGFVKSPALLVAFSPYELDRMVEHLGDAISQDLPARRIDAAEVHEIEPSLSPRIAGGVLFPEDGVIDPKLLVAALEDAARRAGAKIRSHCPATRLLIGERGIEGVEANGETLRADRVVLAAGAWSGSIAGLPAAAAPPVRPLRGQILSLERSAGDKTTVLPTHVVRSMEAYLVPHPDGRLAVGATTEDTGFVKDVTVEGVLGLLRAAYEMVPNVNELAVRAAESGLRPASRDGLPILGPSAIPGLLYATGHQRSGILLWTGTAEALTAWVEDREVPEEARPFTIDRFANADTEADASPHGSHGARHPRPANA